MDNITLGDISHVIAYIVALIGGIGFIWAKLKKWMEIFFRDEMQSLNEKMDSLDSKVSIVDMESCKNYLTDHLSRIDAVYYPLGDIETERFWEQYEHYQKIGGNSYIKRRVEQLQEEGKL